MNQSEAKKALEIYKTRGQDEYKIPIKSVDSDLDGKLSEAILKLCEEQGEYAMCGYVESRGEGGIRYYLVYKPSGKSVKFFGEESIQKYFSFLCKSVGGNIFERDENTNILPYLEISKYNSNVGNCRQALDDILVKSYKNKIKGVANFLLVCTFSELRIHYYVI